MIFSDKVHVWIVLYDLALWCEFFFSGESPWCGEWVHSGQHDRTFTTNVSLGWRVWTISWISHRKWRQNTPQWVSTVSQITHYYDHTAVLSHHSGSLVVDFGSHNPLGQPCSKLVTVYNSSAIHTHCSAQVSSFPSAPAPPAAQHALSVYNKTQKKWAISTTSISHVVMSLSLKVTAWKNSQSSWPT